MRIFDPHIHMTSRTTDDYEAMRDVGVAVGRILGLEARITPELQRMVADYASERRAAGRSVPDDITYILGVNGSRR